EHPSHVAHFLGIEHLVENCEDAPLFVSYSDGGHPFRMPPYLQCRRRGGHPAAMYLRSLLGTLACSAMTGLRLGECPRMPSLPWACPPKDSGDVAGVAVASGGYGRPLAAAGPAPACPVAGRDAEGMPGKALRGRRRARHACVFSPSSGPASPRAA